MPESKERIGVGSGGVSPIPDNGKVCVSTVSRPEYTAEAVGEKLIVKVVVPLGAIVSGVWTA